MTGTNISTLKETSYFRRRHGCNDLFVRTDFDTLAHWLEVELFSWEASMPWFNHLKLNTKFNLILSSLLLSLFLLTAFLAYQDQQELVFNMALEQGRGVARQIIETTDYMSAVVRNEPENNYALVPQVVATQVAKRISTGNTYTVRQVSQKFRNPDNRPDAYETEQLKFFANSEAEESYRVAKENGQDFFRYMQSMVAEESCLECHGSYESAPLFIQQRYPKGHPSYNYQVGQVVGAVSITKPMADLYQEVGTNLKHELIYRVGILALVFVTVGALIRRLMINPIRLTSSTIHRVTRTGNLTERIPSKASHDEVGQLVCDFNEMMAALDRTTLQRQESEDRYRNLIEATDSAIVTFLKDGKVVISNQLAEQMLGLPRHQLLGETIFDYFEDLKSLQERIATIAQESNYAESDKAISQRLRDSSGNVKNVELTLLLASRADHTPVFTAIIRKATE